MKYDKAYFDEPLDRSNTGSFKWDCAKKGDQQLIPMWVADMDFRCAKEITSALIERAEHPAYGYTNLDEQAATALSGYLLRRHGLSIKSNEQAMLPCVITGLRIAVDSLTEKGDKVIYQPPGYGPFLSSITDDGRVPAANPLIQDKDERWRMDLEGLEALLKDGARLMLLCSPHNPVSRLWTKQELSELLALLGKYNCTLVCDEIHQDFVYDNAVFTPILSLNAKAPVVALVSATKTFNIAGLQQAAMLTRDLSLLHRLTDDMNKVGVTSGNLFALIGTKAAYEKGDAWLDALIPYLQEGRDLALEAIASRLPRCRVSPMQATYLMWLDMRDYGLSEEKLLALMADAGVMPSGGTIFSKTLGEGFLRLNIACPHSQTLTAIDRMGAALKGR